MSAVSWDKLLDALFSIYIKQFHPIRRIWAWFNFTTNQFITDEKYYIPTLSELYDFISKWVRDYLPLMHYKYDVFDCDDFSMEFKVKAQDFFEYKYNGFGFAWGLLCFDNYCGGHAWNIVLLSDYGYGRQEYGFGIVFVEPQTGEILQIVEDKYLRIVSKDGFRYVFYGVII